MTPLETISPTMEPNGLQTLSLADSDGRSAQLKRQGGRSGGQNGNSGPPSRSPRPGGHPLAQQQHNMQVQMGYGYPPSSQPYMYQQMMAYQHQGQHVAPRQLPPYVSGPALPLRQGGPRVPSGKASPASPSPTAAVGDGWGGLPLGSSDDEQEQRIGGVDGALDGEEEDAPPRYDSDTLKEEADGVVVADHLGTDDDNNTSRDESHSSSVGTSRQHSGGGGRRQREITPCAFFLKTGSCAYGDRCKFEHPYEQAPKVIFNSLGLPLRPEEPPCSFYLKNFRCAFGHTCKYNHPEPPGQLGSSPPMASMAYPIPPSMAGMQYVPVHYQAVQGGIMAPMHQHMQAMGYYPTGMDGTGTSTGTGGGGGNGGVHQGRVDHGVEMVPGHRGGGGGGGTGPAGQRPQSARGRQYISGPVQQARNINNQMYDMRNNGAPSGYGAGRGGQRYDAGGGGGMPYGPRPIMVFSSNVSG